MNIPNRAPWINIAVGIMTIISPFVMLTSVDAKWAIVIPGIVIAIVAIIEMAVYSKSTGVSYWPIVNIAAGVWLFIATAFVSGDMGMIWSNVILGVSSIVTAIVAMSYETTHAHVSHPVSR